MRTVSFKMNWIFSCAADSNSPNRHCAKCDAAVRLDFCDGMAAAVETMRGLGRQTPGGPTKEGRLGELLESAADVQ